MLWKSESVMWMRGSKFCFILYNGNFIIIILIIRIAIRVIIIFISFFSLSSCCYTHDSRPALSLTSSVFTALHRLHLYTYTAPIIIAALVAVVSQVLDYMVRQARFYHWHSNNSLTQQQQERNNSNNTSSTYSHTPRPNDNVNKIEWCWLNLELWCGWIEGKFVSWTNYAPATSKHSTFKLYAE